MALKDITDNIDGERIAAACYRCHLRVIRGLLLRRAVALGRVCVRLRIRHGHRHRLGAIRRHLIVRCFGWVVPGRAGDG